MFVENIYPVYRGNLLLFQDSFSSRLFPSIRLFMFLAPPNKNHVVNIYVISADKIHVHYKLVTTNAVRVFEVDLTDYQLVEKEYQHLTELLPSMIKKNDHLKIHHNSEIALTTWLYMNKTD